MKARSPGFGSVAYLFRRLQRMQAVSRETTTEVSSTPLETAVPMRPE